MKTIYIKPETTIVKVSPCTLLAGSPGIVNGGSADTESAQEGGGYMLGRGFSFWDDEE
ncbi:MAG: hypothetical protein IJ559_03085 [Prevotella sp.]|nr:hypothetical protein [Prevotella sp.]